ncbi:hypothetical protein [Nonomuraea sp. NPDC050783]|uniref:hypothetical protein n=1 Tax=Nonomuraea sp. NPDC050783 TaxID=3154634 RepID=UPI003466E948
MLARAAVELHGTYGDREQVLTSAQTNVVIRAAQLLADLSEFDALPASPQGGSAMDGLADHEIVGLVTTAVELWETYGDPNDILSAFQREILVRAAGFLTSPTNADDDDRNVIEAVQRRLARSLAGRPAWRPGRRPGWLRRRSALPACRPTRTTSAARSWR